MGTRIIIRNVETGSCQIRRGSWNTVNLKRSKRIEYVTPRELADKNLGFPFLCCCNISPCPPKNCPLFVKLGYYSSQFFSAKYNILSIWPKRQSVGKEKGEKAEHRKGQTMRQITVRSDMSGGMSNSKSEKVSSGGAREKNGGGSGGKS